MGGTLPASSSFCIVSMSETTFSSVSSGMNGLMMTDIGTSCTSSLYALCTLVILDEFLADTEAVKLITDLSIYNNKQS